jgi:8-oxo-dGTP pyrophosphatase MutT (NUDIX family)
MLVDHVKSQAVLLASGHVDDQEDPRVSVVREADEELRLDAKFHDVAGDRPLFLSVTQTRGQDSHIDVTLLVAANSVSRIDRFPQRPQRAPRDRDLPSLGVMLIKRIQTRTHSHLPN